METRTHLVYREADPTGGVLVSALPSSTTRDNTSCVLVSVQAASLFPSSCVLVSVPAASLFPSRKYMGEKCGLRSLPPTG